MLGIGLNVAVRLEELPRRACAEQRRHAGAAAPEQVEPLLERLLQALSDRLAQPPDELLDAWSARDALRGRRVAWGPAAGLAGGAGEEGVAQGVDGTGRLIVSLDAGGQTTLEAGEVHLARRSRGSAGS